MNHLKSFCDTQTSPFVEIHSQAKQEHTVSWLLMTRGLFTKEDHQSLHEPPLKFTGGLAKLNK